MAVRETTYKYGAVKTTIDGVVFASRMESRRYLQLKALQRGGIIRGLELQPKFPLTVNGYKVCDYFADFSYIDCHSGRTIVEDVKGVKTAVYSLKKKLVKAIYGFSIVEVQA